MTRYFRVSVLDYNEVLEFSNCETEEEIESACEDCQRTMFENLSSGISELTEEEFVNYKKTGSFIW
jgi:primosomal protein N'